MLGPDGGEGPESAGGLDVTDDTNNNHLRTVSESHCSEDEDTYRRSLDDSSGLDDFLLVHLGSWSVKVANDCGHSSLVAHGSSQMRLQLGVVLGEALHTSSVAGSTLSRQECQRTMTRCFELTAILSAMS